MYHGSLVERNGLDLAVEALALAREKMPKAELRVFGPRTPFLERVMETVQAKGMQDIVHYLGPRRLEELVHEIEACDVGVIPNQRNPFTDINTPTRIFEYLAIGKPVIAPNTLGIRDYFDEKSLVYFEPGDAPSLAKQMENVYSHRNELSQIACKGQEIYLAHTWEQERKTLLDWCESNSQLDSRTNMPSMKRIALVTGAEGFIGSHLVKFLQAEAGALSDPISRTMHPFQTCRICSLRSAIYAMASGSRNFLQSINRPTFFTLGRKACPPHPGRIRSRRSNQTSWDRCIFLKPLAA